MTSGEPSQSPDGGEAGAAALRAERFSPVLDRMSEGLVIATMDGRLVFWNRAGLAMHAYSDRADAIASLDTFSSVFELRSLDGALLPLDEWPMSRVIRGEDVRDVEILARRLDMPWERWLIYTGGTFVTRTGIELAFVTITDITAWRRAERERDGRDRRLRLAMEAAGVGTYETDASRQEMTFSSEAASLTGFPPDLPISGSEVLTRFHPAERSVVMRDFRSFADAPEGTIARVEHRWITEEGEVRNYAWAARIMDVPGAPPGSRRVGALIDVTAARRTERRLATQLAVTEQLAEPGPIDEMLRGILGALCEAEDFDIGTWWEVDPRDDVIRCGEIWGRSGRFDALAEFSRGLSYRRGEGMAGLVWASGEPLAFDQVPDDPAHLRTPMARGLGLRSFVAFPVSANGRVVGVVDFLGTTPLVVDRSMLDALVAIGRQIGLALERRRLEAELLQAQRIEALGVLARGIAHDFNNILTAVTGNVELVLRDPELPAAARDRLVSVMAASGHARDLVDQIRAFAQPRPGPRAPLSLIGVAAESVRLLRSTVPLPVDIRLVTDHSPTVLADATQLQQVIVNLGVNAWQALRSGAGSIEVRVGIVDADASDPHRPASGRYGVVSVSDDGEGMDEATLQRIFDPFFTTRAPRGGTGLGLSVVHGIVRAHGGHVEVQSTVGVGTRVDVLLPAQAEAQSHQDPVDDAPTAAAALSVPGAHVLFVDDEPLLADLAVQMFPALGFRVTVCTDPAEAIAILRAGATDIDVVVTDMSMPRHTGLEVAAAAAQTRPDLPVLLVSGYVSADMTAEAERLGVREVISKPVSMDALDASLRRALS